MQCKLCCQSETDRAQRVWCELVVPLTAAAAIGSTRHAHNPRPSLSRNPHRGGAGAVPTRLPRHQLPKVVDRLERAFPAQLG